MGSRTYGDRYGGWADDWYGGWGDGSYGGGCSVTSAVSFGGRLRTGPRREGAGTRPSGWLPGRTTGAIDSERRETGQSALVSSCGGRPGPEGDGATATAGSWPGSRTAAGPQPSRGKPVGYADSVHTAYAIASALRFSAVSSMSAEVSQDEW
ncbi:hypothetical protein ACE1SV_69950 [Streptomyces sennicomposti]